MTTINNAMSFEDADILCASEDIMNAIKGNFDEFKTFGDRYNNNKSLEDLFIIAADSSDDFFKSCGGLGRNTDKAMQEIINKLELSKRQAVIVFGFILLNKAYKDLSTEAQEDLYKTIASRKIRYTYGKAISSYQKSYPYETNDTIIGDYVLATQYQDGLSKDPFCVGYLSKYKKTSKSISDIRYYISDSKGELLSHIGMRRAEKISGQVGEMIIDNIDDIEQSNISIWDYAEQCKLLIGENNDK